MNKSLLKEELDEASKSLITRIEGDGYCNKLIEILSNVPLSPKLVRGLEALESKFIKEKQFFSNGNLKILHKCLTNQRGCSVFLLVDEGYNISELTKEIVGKAKKKYLNSRNSITNWLDMYEGLGLIKESSLSTESEKVYEKNLEKKEIIDFVNYMCMRNLRLATQDIIKSSVPEDVLKRNHL